MLVTREVFVKRVNAQGRPLLPEYDGAAAANVTVGPRVVDTLQQYAVVTYEPDPSASREENLRMAEALIPSHIHEGPFTFNGRDS